MGGTRRTVCFSDAEFELVLAAAVAAGLTPNKWIRRACVEAAQLERAVDARDAEVSVAAQLTPAVRTSEHRVERSFTPDFKRGAK